MLLSFWKKLPGPERLKPQPSMSSNRAVISAHGRLDQENPEMKTSLHSELHREFYQLHCELQSNSGVCKSPQDSQWSCLSYGSSLMNYYFYRHFRVHRSESSW